ncbi:tetratricopeptide repeat protein [Aquimarina sp. 2201CG5-10]|uniref:tetratricopeptide repeat protein n=1 Tax=Aquimarina callyspongiae TaxID=3098150 RepID=UPI002AB4A21D|nr:tetratricopeptide repeat protein [Aquimarina sp. 2201CG5-10]MDY8134642.1 tetratricopeptide repeat protein [Aquimarina sp. 2201CG5-10]
MIQRLLVLLFFVSFTLNAQDMNQGFNFLETGKYKDAASFFSTILKEFPDNKTARLCYGRAVGLLGESAKAVDIFNKLKKEYPNDFEIKLNYAESLLWDKQFTNAEGFYENLVSEDPSSFSAVLGYANTLSNLKKYAKALDEVNKALNIKPKNTNALVSRKYIRLGYAFEYSQNKQYEEALRLLDLNLLDFPDDKDTLLNKANIFLITNQYEKAEQSYRSLAKSSKDSVFALNGLSLVAHKKHKDKLALQFAKKSKDKATQFKADNNLWSSAQERYIQALLWNQKFKLAKVEIEKLKSSSINKNQVAGLEASLGMYTSDFKMSLDRYQSILKSEVKSFDGNLGIANAYRAAGQDLKTYEYAFTTLKYYPGQQDAEKLIKTLKKSHTPFIEKKTNFTFDNGDNEAISLSVLSEIPLSTRFKTTVNYSYRTTENTVTKNSATSHDASLGMEYKFTGDISFSGKIGINNSNAFTTDYTQITAEVLVKTKPFKLQNLDLGYKRELQNFNADLIDREIVMNNYYLNYNLGTNFNLGWYTQYMYTTQSDNNTRNLLFTSVYYTFLRRPTIKAGLNYQYIAFKDQVPTIYFSPEKFNLGELFAEVSNTIEKKWTYTASIAVGQQFVENDDASSTFRTEGKLGYLFSDRFSGNIYGKYSNIASATAAGFEFTEFGFRLKWYFLNKPIFDKKIMELKK